MSYSSSHFTGAAATWLEAFLAKKPGATWDEFVLAVQGRFLHNQHQVLLRRLLHLSQTGTVEEYVQKFSDLIDQLAAFDPHPDPLGHLTKFLDGLKPTVRVLVAIQQPDTLDAAYTMALLYEELGEGSSIVNVPSHQGSAGRRGHPLPLPPPPPPSRWVSKTVEEKRTTDNKKLTSDDKWQNLKAYRRAKGLCFTCGERWGKEHQCKGNIQLHIVQEMIECMQDVETDEEEGEHQEGNPKALVMMLSVAAVNNLVCSLKTMKLNVQIQGKQFCFLVDSGSSSC